MGERAPLPSAQWEWFLRLGERGEEDGELLPGKPLYPPIFAEGESDASECVTIEQAKQPWVVHNFVAVAHHIFLLTGASSLRPSCQNWSQCVRGRRSRVGLLSFYGAVTAVGSARELALS